DSALICKGDSVVFTDTALNGRWSASESFVAVSGGVVRQSGSLGEEDPSVQYSEIYYIVGNVCGVDTATKTVRAQRPPYAGFYLSETYIPGFPDIGINLCRPNCV